MPISAETPCATQNEYVYSSKKLSALERGLAQKIFVSVVYILSATILAFGLEWLDRHAYLKIVSQAESQGKISENVSRLFIQLIDARNESDFIHIVLFGLFCGLIVFGFVRLAARLQWSKTVELPQAVEFRQAMEKMGIHDPDDRIDFVRRHGVPVYIAAKPFIGMERELVKARLYAFSDSLYISNKEVFNAYTGQQRLCLDGEDYKYLQEKFGQQAQMALTARIVSLEDTVTRLRGELSASEMANDKLKEDISKLNDEIEAYRNKDKTAAGREKKLAKWSENKNPFRRVAYSLVNRLIADAQPGETYTRPVIQEEFLRELENFPELKGEISQVLQAHRREDSADPFDLSGWAMEEIRAALGKHVKKDPGRQK